MNYITLFFALLTVTLLSYWVIDPLLCRCFPSLLKHKINVALFDVKHWSSIAFWYYKHKPDKFPALKEKLEKEIEGFHLDTSEWDKIKEDSKK